MDLRARVTEIVRGQHRSAWVAGAGVVTGVVWILAWWIASPRCAVPHLELQPGGVVSYSKLLEEYTIPALCPESGNYVTLYLFFLASIFALALAFLAGFVRLVSGGKKWLLTTVLSFAAIVLLCGSLWGIMLSGGGTPLVPLETTRFGGQVVHLARVIYSNRGMDFSDRVVVYLFVCDRSDESCRVQIVDENDLGVHGKYRLKIDKERDVLTVYKTGSHDYEWSVATVEAPITGTPGD